MATRKIYGVNDLIEWRCVISRGIGSIVIPFTGGATTAFGVTPAEFSTSNPKLQAVIEHSEQYQSGRIYLLRQHELGEAGNVQENETAPAPELKAIEVGSYEDAVAYMKDKYGIAAKKLTSKAALTKTATQVGIKFVYPLQQNR